MLPSMITASTAGRWRALALLSAIFGIGVSAYLLVEYTTGQPGICLTGSGCDEVRASDFAYPLGMPMPLFGVAFYTVAVWLAYRTLRGGPILGFGTRTLLLLAGLAGVAMSAALTAIEAFVIESFCTWCLASAAASVLLLVGAVGLWRSPDEEEPLGTSGRARQHRARAEAEQRRSLRGLMLWGGVATAGLFSVLLVAGAVASGPGPQQTGDALAPAGSPRLGSGAVTVVEFADFQCPACAVVGPMLQEMAAANEMTLVFRHFPLEAIHANANASSRAAEAAERQGAFYDMSEALYASQSAWANLAAAEADAYFASLAGQLGLDVDQWRADYASSEVRADVTADAQAAQRLNLPGTPTIYIGGELYEGERTVPAFRAAIAAAAARQAPAGSGG
jgi:protein-disulfide isomerase